MPGGVVIARFLGVVGGFAGVILHEVPPLEVR